MSAVQLLAVAFTFLVAVISLDVFWVRTANQLHGGDIGVALRKRSWLNALVALGAAGAVILLFLWVSTCSNGAF
jgi:hypothetical protein